MTHLFLATLAFFLSSSVFANHVFIGSIVSNNEAASIAVFSVTGEAGTIEARVGDKVADWEVEKIDYGIVYLKRGRLKIYTRSNDEIEEAATRAVYTGIRRRGEKIFIDPSARQFLLTEGLMRAIYGASSIPKHDPLSGELVGYELNDIDYGSIYDLVGIKNRDVVVAIDGVRLTSPSVAIKELIQLRTKRSFTVSLVSGDDKKTLIVEPEQG